MCVATNTTFATLTTLVARFATIHATLATFATVFTTVFATFATCDKFALTKKTCRRHGQNDHLTRAKLWRSDVSHAQRFSDRHLHTRQSDVRPNGR